MINIEMLPDGRWTINGTVFPSFAHVFEEWVRYTRKDYAS
jgi:hypothetical protein